MDTGGLRGCCGRDRPFFRLCEEFSEIVCDWGRRRPYRYLCGRQDRGPGAVLYCGRGVRRGRGRVLSDSEEEEEMRGDPAGGAREVQRAPAGGAAENRS